MSKGRLSNIELLRIISMLGIVLFHSIYHTDYDLVDSNLLNELYMKYIQVFGEVGVNIFMLISGYFMIEKQGDFGSVNSFNKILRFWILCEFYSVVIFVILGCVKGFSVVDKGLGIILPLTYNVWWFASVYFVLLIFSPLLSNFLRKLSRAQYKKMLLIMFVLWSVIPTITKMNFYGNGLVWCFFLYCLAGYIKIYNPFRGSSLKYFLLAGGEITLVWIATFFIHIYDLNIPLFGKYVPYFYDYKYVPTFTIALLVFVAFTKINIGTIDCINSISSTMFGVYLIHDHPLMRNYLWNDVLHLDIYGDNFIPYSIIRVIVVVICCSILEAIRQKIFAIIPKWFAII